MRRLIYICLPCGLTCWWIVLMCQNAGPSEQWTPAMWGHLYLDTGVSAEGGDYCI